MIDNPSEELKELCGWNCLFVNNLTIKDVFRYFRIQEGEQLQYVPSDISAKVLDMSDVETALEYAQLTGDNLEAYSEYPWYKDASRLYKLATM